MTARVALSPPRRLTTMQVPLPYTVHRVDLGATVRHEHVAAFANPSAASDYARWRAGLDHKAEWSVWDEERERSVRRYRAPQ